MSFIPENKTYIADQPIVSVVFNEVILSQIALGDTVIYDLPNSEE